MRRYVYVSPHVKRSPELIMTRGVQPWCRSASWRIATKPARIPTHTLTRSNTRHPFAMVNRCIKVKKYVARMSRLWHSLRPLPRCGLRSSAKDLHIMHLPRNARRDSAWRHSASQCIITQAARIPQHTHAHSQRLSGVRDGF